MSDTVIVLLGILVVTGIITVVALIKGSVGTVLPIITLLIGLAGGGAVSKVTSDSASEDTAKKAVEQVQVAPSN